MAFPYNNAIPQATDFPAQSQPLMLQNFNSTDLILQVDHMSFTEAPAGAHNKVSFINSAATAWPVGVTYGLYATAAGIFAYTPGGNNNFTEVTHVVAAGALAGDVYTTTLPSGLIIKSGKLTGNGYNITDASLVFPTQIYSAVVSPSQSNAHAGANYPYNATVYALSPVSFGVNCTNFAGNAAAAVTFTFYAIGI